MKKLSRAVLILGLLAILTACGQKKTATTESSKESGESSVSSSEIVDQEAILTATVENDVVLEGENISLKLIKVQAEEDPEKILGSLSEGFVLNVTKEIFSTEFSEESFKAGAQVRVVLDALPMMTRSLPPQIPGKSVRSISLVTADQSSAKVDIFTAILKEDARIDESHPDTVFLSLDEVKPDGDTPEDAGAFANQGAILNAGLENFEKPFEKSDFKAGKKIRFTLKSPAAMTMSIPPQIPGNSILVIEEAK